MVRELQRNENVEEPGVEDLIVGNLTLQLASFRAVVGGKTVHLTAREFDLLGALAARAGRVVPFETLAQEVLGASDRKAVRHLNVLVHRMRTKLVDLRPYVLETVRSRGYGLLQGQEEPGRSPRDRP